MVRMIKQEYVGEDDITELCKYGLVLVSKGYFVRFGYTGDSYVSICVKKDDVEHLDTLFYITNDKDDVEKMKHAQKTIAELVYKEQEKEKEEGKEGEDDYTVRD